MCHVTSALLDFFKPIAQFLIAVTSFGLQTRSFPPFHFPCLLHQVSCRPYLFQWEGAACWTGSLWRPRSLEPSCMTVTSNMPIWPHTSPLNSSTGDPQILTAEVEREIKEASFLFPFTFCSFHPQLNCIVLYICSLLRHYNNSPFVSHEGSVHTSAKC